MKLPAKIVTLVLGGLSIVAIVIAKENDSLGLLANSANDASSIGWWRTLGWLLPLAVLLAPTLASVSYRILFTLRGQRQRSLVRRIRYSARGRNTLKPLPSSAPSLQKA